MSRKALAAFLLALTIFLPQPAAAQRRRKRTRRTTTQRSYKTISHNERITPSAFVVAPGQFNYFPVTLVNSTGSGILTGRFRAQGGSGNDIEVFVVDEDGLENYKNGHRVPTYYNSGRVTVGTINAVIVEGHTYYLVFNNRFSTFSNKAITADISLMYDQPVNR